MILEHLQPVRGLPGAEAGLHGAVAVVLGDEGVAVALEDLEVLDELFLEVLLDCQEEELDVHGLALELEPVEAEVLDLLGLLLRQLDLVPKFIILLDLLLEH